MTTETATLLFHIDWIFREFEPDWLVTFAGELWDVRGQLRGATGERGPAVVGYCEQITEGGQVCQAPLRLAEGTSIIRCPRCRETYDADAMIREYQAVKAGCGWDADCGLAVSASVAAMMVREAGIPCDPNVFRLWVHRGHIRRAGPRSYDVVSIMDYLAQRLVNDIYC